MFKFDPQSHYMMPAHFGPRLSKGSARYGDVTTMAVTYLTDRDMLARYVERLIDHGVAAPSERIGKVDQDFLRTHGFL